MPVQGVPVAVAGGTVAVAVAVGGMAVAVVTGAGHTCEAAALKATTLPRVVPVGLGKLERFWEIQVPAF